MRLLAFSDLHRNLHAAAALVERARDVDAVAGVGDFASFNDGLEQTIGALRSIDKPTVLVAGNHETDQALRRACEGWPSASVLHGEGTSLAGVAFFGLGGAVPPTPWEWSFDLSEAQAAEKLAACPPGAVLVVHSPPQGHLDLAGRHLGSTSVLAAIETRAPRLVLCGHIHECWGQESTVGGVRVLNLGPRGRLLEV